MITLKVLKGLLTQVINFNSCDKKTPDPDYQLYILLSERHGLVGRRQAALHRVVPEQQRRAEGCRTATMNSKNDSSDRVVSRHAVLVLLSWCCPVAIRSLFILVLSIWDSSLRIVVRSSKEGGETLRRVSSTQARTEA